MVLGVVLLGAVLIIPLGLPGTWAMVAAAIAYALLVPHAGIGIVTIGGVAATTVVVGSSTSIIANTGAHAAGAVDVVVTNTDAQFGTLTGGYTYTAVAPAPTVTAISPVTGLTTGGTVVRSARTFAAQALIVCVVNAVAAKGDVPSFAARS